MSTFLLLCIAAAVIASLILTPIVRRLAHVVGIVDKPDHSRKLHGNAIALGGGVAVFTSMVLVVIVAFGYLLSLNVLPTEDIDLTKWYALFGAGAAILVIGLIDDKWTIRGRQKLALQCLVVGLMVAFSSDATVVDKLTLFGYDFHPSFAVSFALISIWLLVAINALNLIDGADGVATTAGCIICAGLGFLCIRNSITLEGIAAFALSGALAGFLVFNRPPATIFLGDAGSMVIGLFVGVLAVWSHVKEPTAVALAPLAIFALPLLDSSAAILRRWLTGRSIYIADRAHVHHVLQAKYGSNRMLLIVAALCISTTGLAVISTYSNIPWLTPVGVGVVLILLIVTRSFGHAECHLLVTRASQFARSFAALPNKDGVQNVDRRVPLQGTGQWETIWEPLIDFAKTHDLNKVKIDLNLAWLHEGYHATWQSVRMPERELQLQVRMPLFTTRKSDNAQACVGSLEIIAAANNPSVYDRISDLSDKLVDLCPQIDAIVADLELEQQQERLKSYAPTDDDSGISYDGETLELESDTQQIHSSAS